MTAQYVRTQILLDPQTRERLDRVARQEDRSLSDLVRELLQEQLKQRMRREMAAAAEALRADYETDAELTAFVALDGEDVHA